LVGAELKDMDIAIWICINWV